MLIYLGYFIKVPSLASQDMLSLSLFYWVTSNWLLSLSEPEFPNEDRIRLDDHCGSSYQNILQLISSIHSQSLPQPTMATVLATGGSMRT